MPRRCSAFILAILIACPVLCLAAKQVNPDRTVQLAELTASDGAAEDTFGFSVAVSGDTLVIGAPGAKIGSNDLQGAAYVFVKSPSGWIQAARLTASDGVRSDAFGTSVAVNQGVVVVGTPYHFGNDGSKNFGAAYVFVKPQSGWHDMVETAELTPSDGSTGGDFAVAVSINAHTVAVGAFAETINGVANEGAIYVFVQPEGGWRSTTETAKLTVTDGNWDEGVAQSIAIRNDVIVAGAGCAMINGKVCQGAAYVFVRSNDGWADMTETAKLTASDGAMYDALGGSVAIRNHTIVVGAGGHNAGVGAAYVYLQPPAGWTSATETAELGAKTNNQIGLGAAVGIHGKRIMAAAPIAPIRHRPQVGLFVEYVEPLDGWGTTSTPNIRKSAADGAANDNFGWAAAMNQRYVLVGAPHHFVNGESNVGAAYVFGRN